ncbi:hypothetical protein C8J57DRAFT_1519967 [Mycena rebaudengoi]|nr:hypothetical protein C8J57DRAFT_1519967 [Mycena rebaudengoi]
MRLHRLHRSSSAVFLPAALNPFFAHSYCIGGSSELLDAGAALEIIMKLSGWTSLCFLIYWRRLKCILPLNITRAWDTRIREFAPQFSVSCAYLAWASIIPPYWSLIATLSDSIARLCMRSTALFPSHHLTLIREFACAQNYSLDVDALSFDDSLRGCLYFSSALLDVFRIDFLRSLRVWGLGPSSSPDLARAALLGASLRLGCSGSVSSHGPSVAFAYGLRRLGIRFSQPLSRLFPPPGYLAFGLFGEAP